MLRVIFVRRFVHHRGMSALAILLVACLLMPDSIYGNAGKRVPARLTESSGDRVVFRVDLEPWAVTPSEVLDGTHRVTVPGFIPRGNPGEPARPARKYMIGLPEDGTWRLSFRVLNSVSLGSQRLEPVPYEEIRPGGDLGGVAAQRYEIDSASYNTYRSPPAVSSGAPAWIRRQRVLPVWVEPLTYDPATGQATLATSIEITVSFSAGSGRDDEDRRSGRGLKAESRGWEDIYSRLLVNADKARSWRRPRVSPADLPQRTGVGTYQGTSVKLAVRKTGIHKVSANVLVAAGFPMNQSVDDLHLFKRGYNETSFSGTVTDVAFDVSEHPAGTPGVFDGGDLLVFYGARLGDDAVQGDPHEQISDHNVYWLGTTSGLSMIDRTLDAGFLTADTASAYFRQTQRFMDDRVFLEETPPGRTDYYFYNGAGETVVDFPFEIDTVRPGSALSLTAELHGGLRQALRSVSTHVVNSHGDTVVDQLVWVSDVSVINYQANILAASLDTGNNTFRFQRSDYPGSPIRVHLNWLNVSYDALYRARGNTLAFNTASLSGDTSIVVTCIGDTTGLWLFDVTDPVRPMNCVLDGSLFTDVGDSYALVFRDAIGTQKDYILVPESRMIEIGAGDVVLDSPSAIVGDPAESGVDVLAIAHGDFVDGMREWASYRRTQEEYKNGVLLVDVEDVYDEFNGGVKGTRAIDRFVRHFFELGNAGYVVLVGDASEDHKHVFAQSGPDFIPSHARSEYADAPFNKDEVVTLDKPYVKLPGPGGIVDNYPDLVIGRIPAGDINELQRVINKVFLYEQPAATDTWRRRMILVADDSWSGNGITSSCYYTTEFGFERGQDTAADIINSAYPGLFEVVRFNLSEHTDPYHPDNPFNGYCSYDLYNLRINVRNEITPLFMEELKQGATFVIMQAHTNRSLVTHEMLFTTMAGSVPGEGGNKDHMRINNRDMPFIIFGMGCHFSDYALHEELGELPANQPNGDCFAEQLLFRNREAAIGTYGSSGFEYLGQVNTFVNLFSQITFYDAPYDTMVNQTNGRWGFGRLMYLTEVTAVGYGQSRPVDRYHLLGDPLLKIDVGPPLMDVTVNGTPVNQTDTLGVAADTIRVEVDVIDENVIEAFELEIDGQPMTDSLVITPVGDDSIEFSRRYNVRFSHALRVGGEPYDIILRALQAPNTVDGGYYMSSEMVLHVRSHLEVTVNGRIIASGDVVPSRGVYSVEMGFPVYVPESEIRVLIDGNDVLPRPDFVHPSPEDSTTWIARFALELAEGRHELTISAGEQDLTFVLIVSSTPGLRDVVNYPNPFAGNTHFVYSNDMEIDEGTIDVYTTSGKKIIRIEIPPQSQPPGQNSVFWDGRDAAGDEIANGVYLYVIRVKQRGQESRIHGKLARIK